MLALSVKQPYAALIAEGHKTLEIRSRATNHRGDLLIVASKRPADEIVLRDGETDVELVLPLGCHICIVAVTDCYPMLRTHAKAAYVDFSPGLWAWELADPRPVEPLPQKGSAAFYHVPDASIRIAAVIEPGS